MTVTAYNCSRVIFWICKSLYSLSLFSNFLTRVRVYRLLPPPLPRILYLNKCCCNPLVVSQLVDTTDGSPVSLFPTVCSMFDRYLSVEAVPPQDLQDVALTALIACSKVLEGGTPLAISKTLHNYLRLNKLKVPYVCLTRLSAEK